MEEESEEERALFARIRLYADPKLCTKAFHGFLSEFRQAHHLFLFTVDLAAQTDRRRVTAAQALIKALGERDPEYDKYKQAIEDPDRVLSSLKKFASSNSRNLVLTTCNSFLCYYSEIIQAAINKRPELLRSKQTIRWDELLGFSRFSDIVSYLIDKKINELSYAGIMQMDEFMSERLGIEAATSDVQRNLVNILVEIRNIHTHNRGVVNSIFLSRVRDHMHFDFVNGKFFHVDYDEFVLLSTNAIEVALLIDEAIAKKFGLRRKRYGSWKADGYIGA